MNFKCPYCRKNLNFLELQEESDLMAIIRLQPYFGKHRDLVWAYCELFGITPLKTRAKKLRLILTEIKTLLEAGAFSFEKKRYAISPAGIIEALGAVARRNFDRPLTNHNYLKSVMITIAEREGQAAGKQAEKDLRAKEDNLQAGIREGAAERTGSAEFVERTDPQDAVKRIGDILKDKFK